MRAAVKSRDLDIIRLLAKDGIVSKGALYEALEDGFLKGAQALVQLQKLDLSDDDNEALMVAVEYGNIPTLLWVLSHEEVDPTARNYEALKLAAMRTDEDAEDRFSLLYDDPKTGNLPEDVRKELLRLSPQGYAAILESDQYEPEVFSEYFPDTYEDDVTGEYMQYERDIAEMAGMGYDDDMQAESDTEAALVEKFGGFY